MIDFLKYLIKTSLFRFSEKTKKKSSQTWDYDDNHDDEIFFNYLNKEKNIEKESDFLNNINSTTRDKKKKMLLEAKRVGRQKKQNAFYSWFDSIDSKEYMTIEGHILEGSEMSLEINQFFIDNYYFAPKASSEAVGEKSKSDMLYFANKSLHYDESLQIEKENLEFKLKYPRLEKLIEILEKQHLPNWFLRNYSVLKKGDYIALNSGEKISLTNKELSMFNFLIEVIDNNSFSHNSNSKKIKKRYSLGMQWMKNNNCDAHNYIKSYFNSKF